MPTTADQTPFATLLPASGWEMLPEVFEAETERNEGFDASILWPGFAQQFTHEIPPTGVVSRLRYLFEGTTTRTIGTGTFAATDAWPHGLISRYALRLNGQATPWNCRGQDLEVLRQARLRNIPAAFELKATAEGANTLRVMWDVPLAIDPAVAPNVGGLFAQSSNSQILSEITTAPVADVATLTGNAAFAIAGAFRPIRTWFSIPTGKLPSSGQAGMILPDLTMLHGVLSQDQPIIGTGEQTVEFNRVQGTIARTWLRMKNGPAASLNPFLTIDEMRFAYASNQRPRVYLPHHISYQNEEWYRGVLPYSAVAIDQLAENLRRDSIDVENLSNPQIVPTITSGTVIQPNARIHAVYEMLAPLA